jgi:argininosuccinate lyase
VARALDPVAFVEIRTVLGGAAPSATTAVLNSQSQALAKDKGWLEDENERLAAASKLLQQQVEALLT